MSHQPIQNLLDAITTKAVDEIQVLADRYRSQKLVPLCKRHKLTFIAGMGHTVFYTRDGESIGDIYDAKQHGLHILVPVFEVLNIAVLNSKTDVFGYYIADIR